MKKVVVFVSAHEARQVRKAIAITGAGRLGNYSSTVSRGVYTGAIRTIDEERIEFACDDATYIEILGAINALCADFAAVESWSLETYS